IPSLIEYRKAKIRPQTPSQQLCFPELCTWMRKQAQRSRKAEGHAQSRNSPGAGGRRGNPVAQNTQVNDAKITALIPDLSHLGTLEDLVLQEKKISLHVDKDGRSKYAHDIDQPLRLGLLKKKKKKTPSRCIHTPRCFNQWALIFSRQIETFSKDEFTTHISVINHAGLQLQHMCLQKQIKFQCCVLQQNNWISPLLGKLLAVSGIIPNRPYPEGPLGLRFKPWPHSESSGHQKSDKRGQLCFWKL
uniref:Uncharacterized protein n=1 Tax=Sus scrofa TaxID=9823 RepID=A0A8D1TFT0_PIG